MAKRSIVFIIINPISGTQSKDNIIELISQHLDQDKFNYQVVRTEYAGHATLLAQEHVEKAVMRLWLLGATALVNEIARSLVHTSVAFRCHSLWFGKRIGTSFTYSNGAAWRH